MNNKLALNMFNCSQTNADTKAYQLKCRNLPKEDRKIYKKLLQKIYQAKREV